MKILDYLMWLMFAVSFLISIFTTLVVFGIKWIRAFATFLPFEISLAATFFIWGLNTVYNSYTKNTKYAAYICFLLGGILLAFAIMGVY